ncbi:MAG: UBA/TS-N domain protein, partial [Firmicutes bacterium]|nr:UBA/TS-N domain protein [Bacillota bacterium]
MDVLEKAEKIREKTGVTYEEAKAALEAADGDILDALVYLERRGKIREPEVSVYTTEASEDTSEEFRQAARNFEDAEKETFGDHVRRFLKWCGRMIEKGCENFFIVEKKGEEMITMP